MSTNPSTLIKSQIRTIRDWPKPGVNFRDITPLFQNPATLRLITGEFAAIAHQLRATHIAAIDARGFVIGAALALQTQLPLILIRKKNKLPPATLSATYTLEYGASTIEISSDACRPGDRVLIIDDLIATGGTLLAAAQLIQNLGAQVAGITSIIDLPGLGGSTKLRAARHPVHPLCSFSESE